MKKKILVSFVCALALVGAIVAVQGIGKGNGNTASLPVAVAQQGDLVIDVLEGGNISALNFMEIRNQVTVGSGVKILDIIDEGYYVTEEDVAEGLVLVRLDASELEEAIVDHDVRFQQTEAAFAEARQAIEIEESEALSAIKAERQKLRFALLDFQKFLGGDAAVEMLQSLSLPFDNDSLAAYEAEATSLIAKSFDTSKISDSLESAHAMEESATLELQVEDSLAANVNFGSFLEQEVRGDGEAEQRIRRMRDEALVATAEHAVRRESVEGARRLHEREFITRQTLDNEEVSLEKAALAEQRSITELKLFQDYEFPKEAERLLSTYEEGLLSLIRLKRTRMARMSQAMSRFRSAQRRYELELRQRENLEQQLAQCVIRAEIPGLVAYGSAGGSLYSSRSDAAVAPGATMRTGQPIITIPDMSRLGVEVNIHESHIKKVELGQKVYITAESVPDQTLVGRVSKVAVLPDSNASRFNPSLKVYPTTVEIEGTHEFLKPGMSAKVEIIVNELEDVTYVPVQSVFVESSEHFVFRRAGSGYERQPVRIGAHNNDFIQLIEGIEPGDEVFLRMPEGYEPPQQSRIAERPDRRQRNEEEAQESVRAAADKTAGPDAPKVSLRNA